MRSAYSPNLFSISTYDSFVLNTSKKMRIMNVIQVLGTTVSVLVET